FLTRGKPGAEFVDAAVAFRRTAARAPRKLLRFTSQPTNIHGGRHETRNQKSAVARFPQRNPRLLSNHLPAHHRSRPGESYPGQPLPGPVCVAVWHVSQPLQHPPNGFVIVPPGTSGTQVALTPDLLPDDLDPNHLNKSFVQMYNNGGVNAGPTKVSCTSSPYCCPNNASECVLNGSWVFNWLHYTENDSFEYSGKYYNRLDPYLAVATQYGWANYFFQTNRSEER